MNINKPSFDPLIENKIFNKDQQNWLNNTIKLIDEQKIIDKSINELSSHLRCLQSFESKDILNLVQRVNSHLKNESEGGENNRIFTNLFKTQIARALVEMNRSDLLSLSFSEEFSWLLVQMAIEQVKKREELNPLNLIHKYGIDNSTPAGQQGLIEIAKLAAQQDSHSLSVWIHQYGLDTFAEGQVALVDIAQSINKKDPTIILKNIGNFGLNKFTEGQKTLIEIANYAPEIEIAPYLGDFDLSSSEEGQKILIEIVNYLVFEKKFDISPNIKNYGLETFSEGQKILVKLALAAEDEELISTHIQNYNLSRFPEGQQELVRIAKLEVERNPSVLAREIENYGLDKFNEGQNALVEIINLLKKNNISNHIQNFNLDKFSEGQETLINIALSQAQENATSLSINISNYRLDTFPAGNQALIEIAKVAASQKDSLCSSYIKNYGFDKFSNGQEILIEIAKIGMQHNPFATLESIQDFIIDKDSKEGKQALIELARYTLNLDTQHVSQIQKFCLNNFSEGKQALIELAKTLLLKDPLKILPYLQYFGIYGFSDSPTINEEIFETFFSSIEKQFKTDQKMFWWIQSSIRSSKDFDIQKQLFEWFIRIANDCFQNEIQTSLFFNNQDILEQISKRDPRLRDRLTNEFKSITDRQNILREFKNLETTKETSHLKLTILILVNFPLVGKDTYIRALNVLSQEKIQFIKGSNQSLLCETLLKINGSLLEDKKKIEFIEMLFNQNVTERLRSLRLISDLLSFKAEAVLREIKDLKELNIDLLIKAIKDLFNLEDKVENFSENYQKTIGSWRFTEALTTYSAKLQELHGEEGREALQYFKQLMLFILNRTFQTERYKTHNNLHMKEIQDHFPAVFEKWQQECHLESSELASFKEAQALEHIQKIVQNIKKRIDSLGSEHPLNVYNINLENIDHDLNSLSNSLKEAEKTHKDVSIDLKNATKDLKQLKDKLKESTKDEKLIIEINNKINSIDKLKEKLTVQEKLKAQCALLEVLKAPKYEKLNTFEQILNKDIFYYESALKELKKTNYDSFEEKKLLAELAILKDFSNGIKLAKKINTTVEKKVIETDNPNHFLLMGTEVKESCQNVMGDPHLNKCLLGYFLDGKHRLCLVCRPDGTILARSVLRLLLDSKNQPVLYQEKIYVADTNSDYESLLRKMATKKAAFLGIPLVGSRNHFSIENAPNYNLNIVAKEKPIPFEYVDALNGEQCGTYTIYNAIQLN